MFAFDDCKLYICNLNHKKYIKMTRGKSICRVLREIRRQIAEANEIGYDSSDCHYQGECAGTCPKCEAEVVYLETQLSARRMAGKAVALAGISTSMFLAACQGETAIRNDIVNAEPITEQAPVSPIENTDTLEVVREFTGEEVVIDDPNLPIDTATYVFYRPDIRPQFPGGKEALDKFIAKNLRYPKDAYKQKIDGTVVVSFIVSREGDISGLSVISSLHPSLDSEARRLVRSMPKFIPAKVDEVNVNASCLLYIEFDLEAKNIKLTEPKLNYNDCVTLSPDMR